MNIPIIVKGRYRAVPVPGHLLNKDSAIPPGLSEVDADDLSYEELARQLAFGYSLVADEKRFQAVYKG